MKVNGPLDVVTAASAERTRPSALRLTGAALAVALIATLAGCFAMLPSQGGGQTEFNPPRQLDPQDVALPAGYRIEVVATGLNLPTGVAFDDQGRPYVVEAGYSYGDVWTTPRLVRVEPDGQLTQIVAGQDPPWNGVTFHDGAFYVAAAGHRDGGRIVRIGMDGATTTLVDSLPSLGDHHTNGPVTGPDGWLYFGQGTATNAGVVGLDNFDFGWVPRQPAFHDIPCRDVTLVGKNYTTRNPLTPDDDDEVATGAYVPFGTPTNSGQTIRGRVPCGGAILRVRPSGGPMELVAWGFRNPFGLAWSQEGRLYVTENAYDVRGSRPVFGTGDVLWRVEPGTWYGWPDFHAGRPLTDADWYEPPGGAAPGFLLAEHPGVPPRPVAMLGVHSSSNGFDFARNPAFGHVGEAFIAQFGDMAPGVGKVLAPVGYRVVRVDASSGVVHDFAVNRGDKNGPASWLGTGGLERPVAVRFDPSGTALYVVDFGVMTTGGDPHPRLGTGVLWRITRNQARQ
jgi:glucose/arabinose dehydrogenase